MFNECAMITHGAMNCDLCQTFTNDLQQTSSNIHVWQFAQWVTSKILLPNFMKASVKSLPAWSPTDMVNQDSHHDAALWCPTPPECENKASFTHKHQTISGKSVRVMNLQLTSGDCPHVMCSHVEQSASESRRSWSSNTTEFEVLTCISYFLTFYTLHL